MNDFLTAISQAASLIGGADLQFYDTVSLSLRVSGTATVLACVFGMPVGAWLAIVRFPGRAVAIATINACLGVPSVLVGLVVYLVLSRSGPLGALGLLFTPEAMIVAQTLLIAPMVAALTRQLLEPTWDEYRDTFTSLQIGRLRGVQAILWDSRFGLTTTVLAAFGRAIAEVGAVMTVGGNIAGATRVMTTSIALETSKGDLATALGLGLVLLALVLAVSSAAQGLRAVAARRYGA